MSIIPILDYPDLATSGLILLHTHGTVACPSYTDATAARAIQRRSTMSLRRRSHGRTVETTPPRSISASITMSDRTFQPAFRWAAMSTISSHGITGNMARPALVNSPASSTLTINKLRNNNTRHSWIIPDIIPRNALIVELTNPSSVVLYRIFMPYVRNHNIKSIGLGLPPLLVNPMN